MGIWHVLFMAAAYSAAAVCLYATYKIGQSRGWQWGVINLLIFLLFYGLFWLLESWASLRTPFYVYPSTFPDIVLYYPWNVSPVVGPCIAPHDDGISRSILFLESSLTFAAMHTAILLTGLRQLRVLRPFMAAIPLLLIDFFLDPLASHSFDCNSLGTPAHRGIGFWDWYVGAELGPDTFGIPLFNYAVWYAAPILLIALAGLLGWFYDALTQAIRRNPLTGQLYLTFLLEGIFLAVIVFAFAVILYFSPNFAGSAIPVLKLVFALLVIGTVVAVLILHRRFEYANPLSWWFIYPQAIFVVFCLVAFLLGGMAAQIPYLWVVAVITTVLVGLWCVSPYFRTLWP